MIAIRKRSHKQPVQFAEPRWNEDSPAWKELDAAIPAEAVARRIVRGVAALDLTELRDAYSGTGSLPYRPELMLAIALIEVQEGRHCPEQWWGDTRSCDVLKWAGFGIRPSRTCWHAFHRRIAAHVDRMNAAVLQRAGATGRTTGQRCSLDGTTIEANASRHRLLNQERLGQRLAALAARRIAEEAGGDLPAAPTWMAKAPQTRLAQQARYAQAGVHLAELLAANQRRNPAKRRKAAKIVVSGSDPEAALGRDKFGVFRPLYNVQLVTDLDSRMILAYETFALPTDAGTLAPMLARLTRLRGSLPATLLVDATYVTGGDLATCAAVGIDVFGPWMENDYSRRKPAKDAPKLPKEQFLWEDALNAYRCPQGNLLTRIGQEKRERADGLIDVLFKYRCPPAHCRNCPQATACTSNPSRGRSVKRSEHEELIDAHKKKMATAAAKTLYRLRRQTVELAFADAKEHRKLRRFSGRGLRRARTQVALLVLTHNLRVLFDISSPAQKGPPVDVTPLPITA